MIHVKHRRERQAAKRRREGYRTGNTVVMPEIEVPVDWTPPPMLPGDDAARCYAPPEG